MISNPPLPRDLANESPARAQHPDRDAGARRSIHTFINTVLNRRKQVLWLALAVVVAAAGGLRFLGLTTDNRVFFGPQNPELLAFEAFEKTYTESNHVMIVFAPQRGDVFTRESLAAIEEFTAEAWRLPFASRVDSLTNFSHSYAQGDDVTVEDLVHGAQQLSDQRLAEIRKIALTEPLLANRLVSGRGHVAGAVMNFILPEDDPKATDTITGELRTLVSAVQGRYPDIDVYLTGDIILGSAVGEATDDDVSLLIPLMFVLIFAIIGILLRSLTITLATLAIIAMAAVTAMGLAGWLGYILNPGSAIAPTIILTIAVADSVHIVANMLEGMRRGLDKRAAIAESLEINFFPVFLTSATTAAGFLSLNFSDSPPFNDLGNLVAIGVLAAYAFSITVLPALLMTLPIPQPRQREHQDKRLIERLGQFVIRRRNACLAVMLVLGVVLVAGLPRIELTDNWIEYFDERYTFRTDSDFIVDNLSGIESMEYSLPAAGPDGINDPVYLAALGGFADWLRAQPGVDNVFSITDVLKRLNKNMHGDDPAFYRLPQTAELAAQYLLMYDLSLPYGKDLNDRIDVARSRTRLTASGDFSAAELRDLEARSQQWLRANAPDYMLAAPTGMSTLFAHISERNIDTMLFGSLLLLALISATLVVALRSVGFGLVSLIPNLVPALMALGMWGWFFGELGMAVSVVGAMTLGIIVDDTVHFLAKYLKARREYGMDSRGAVEYVFRVVGEPLYITTLALLAGFGVLAFSGFQVNWAMGLLSAATIGMALLADFFLLPPLLLACDRKTRSAPHDADAPALNPISNG